MNFFIPIRRRYLSKLRRDSIGADFQSVRKLTNYVCAKPGCFPTLISNPAISLGPSASNEQVARARTPKSNGRGRSVLQGFYPAAAPAKYRSVERMSASNLISSDSTPKIKLIY